MTPVVTSRPTPKPRAKLAPRAIKFATTFSRVLLISTFLIVGFFITLTVWIEPRRVVAEVRMADGDVCKIRLANFQKRLMFERARYMHRSELDFEKTRRSKSEELLFNYRYLSSLGFAGGILDRITREVIIREAAQQNRLSASDSEIDKTIHESNRVVLPPKPAPAKAQSPTAPALGAAHVSDEAAHGANAPATTNVPAPAQGGPGKEIVREMPAESLPTDYREIITTEILEKKLKSLYVEKTSPQQDRAKMKVLRFETEAAAQKAAGDIASPEAFSRLFDRVSAGALPQAIAFVREWSTREELEADIGVEFAREIFRTESGKRFPQPLFSNKGWYLAEVTHREVQTVSDEWRRHRGELAYEKWLEQQQVRIAQNPLWMERVPPDPRALIPGPPFDEGAPPMESGSNNPNNLANTRRDPTQSKNQSNLAGSRGPSLPGSTHADSRDNATNASLPPTRYPLFNREPAQAGDARSPMMPPGVIPATPAIPNFAPGPFSGSTQPNTLQPGGGTTASPGGWSAPMPQR